MAIRLNASNSSSGDKGIALGLNRQDTESAWAGSAVCVRKACYLGIKKLTCLDSWTIQQLCTTPPVAGSSVKPGNVHDTASHGHLLQAVLTGAGATKGPGRYHGARGGLGLVCGPSF